MSLDPSHPPKQVTRPLRFPSILAESEDWIVVDKPPFMAVHPSKPEDRGTLWDHLNALLAYERVNGGQVSIITRLDRETSGVTLVAKSRGAARSLCRQMELHRIQKRYVALVWGWPTDDCWQVDAPLCRQGLHRPSRIWLKQTGHPAGSPASTRFEVLARAEIPTSNGFRFSLVRAYPKTGRMHQIRVHLQLSGHSIVGDKIYGPDEDCYLQFIETGWTPDLQSRLLLPRQALHAETLTLEESGLSWSAPLPEDFGAFLAPANPTP